MPGRDLTSWREAIFAQIDQVKVLQATSVDRRNPARNTAVFKNVAFLYGHRPQHPDIWFLSAYEFMVYWRIEIASYNRDPNDDADKPGH